MTHEPPKVLVVDDETAIRSALRRIVTRAGCQAIEAASAAEALESVEAGAAPVAAICDYNMPGMTGLELSRNLRERHADLPVLMLSGGMPNQEIREALESGLLWAYVAKPWSLPWMKAAIAAMLHGDAPPPLEE